MAAKKIPLEEIKRRIYEKHKDKFDYPFIDKEYKNTKSYITIYCKVHDYFFPQRLDIHMKGSICKKCYDYFYQSMTNHINKKHECYLCNGGVSKDLSIILNIIKFHENLEFPFIEKEYQNYHSDITVYCKVCKETFKSNLIKLITKKKGCDCHSILIEYFLRKTKELFGDKYEYPNYIEELKHNKKITIRCTDCTSVFKRGYNEFINKKLGCYKCSQSYHRTVEELINKLNEAQDKKLTYPNIENEYKNVYSEITTICNDCGNKNKQIIHNLLRGHSCSFCNESKGEKEIKKFLDKHKIKYIRQQKFDECKNIFHLHFDFYLPEFNICIEFDGEQHFRPMEIWGGQKNLDKIKNRDNIKNNFCLENNIRLERIRYDENIDKRMNEILNTLKFLT